MTLILNRLLEVVEVMFTHNFIKLSAAVHDILC